MNSMRNWSVTGLAASLALAAGVGCSQLPTDTELLEATGAAALVASEDEGDVAEASAAGLTDGELSAAADESATSDVDRDPVTESASFDACDFSARRERIRRAYDANGDGRLDPAELAALREDLSERVESRLGLRFGRLLPFVRHMAFRRVKWAFDVNGDGRLDREERMALVLALEHRCQVIRQRILAEFDANGDGRLGLEELAAARAAFRERLAARRAEVLARYDVNGNGVLDPDEREALRQDLVARLQARREAILAEFDANGNGVLDPDEIAALKQAIRERVALATEGEGG